jgi:hypothetical protein
LVEVRGLQAQAPAGDVDEIKDFQNCRYVSTCEAGWRLLSFDLHGERPSVVRMAVHLPDQQQVFFNPDNITPGVPPPEPASTLTAWMDFNRQLRVDDPLRSVLYQDFPAVCTWNKKDKVWKQRQVLRQRLPVGRMYFVRPSDMERFCLRTLLHHVPGATCWEDLRTTRDAHGIRVVHDTFQAACQARGLLQDDAEWFKCMEEAASVSGAFGIV